MISKLIFICNVVFSSVFFSQIEYRDSIVLDSVSGFVKYSSVTSPSNVKISECFKRNDSLFSSIHYNNGQLAYVHNSKLPRARDTIYCYYSSGGIKSIYTFDKGVNSGIWIEFGKNNKIINIIDYRDNKGDLADGLLIIEYEYLSNENEILTVERHSSLKRKSKHGNTPNGILTDSLP